MSKKPTASAPAIDAQIKPYLDEWMVLTKRLEVDKAREIELRKYLGAVFFPTPEEGVNRIKTADGFEFALEHKINRKLDEAALDAVMSELPEESPYRNLGVLIQYKPSLVLSGYREMPADQKLIFSQALTETPGTPSLEVNILTEESEAARDPATAPTHIPAAHETVAAPDEPAPAKKTRKKRTPKATA